MKIRTTLHDLNCGHVQEACSPLMLSAKGVFYSPLPVDRMDHVKQEVPSNNFNGLSISDVQTFSHLQGMDKLHKADAVSDMYRRGLNIRHQSSKQDFLSHYNK